MADDDLDGEPRPTSSDPSGRSIPRRGTTNTPVNDDDDRERTGPESRVAVELGALRVETHGDSLDEAERAFYRVWQHVTDEMDEMTDAMRERLGGYQ